MIDLVTWLLAVEILGLLAFPLTFVLLGRLPDRGYTITKPLVLVLCAYLLWILGLTRIAPNTWYTIAGITAGLLAVSAYFTGRYFRQIKAFFQAEWKAVATAEVLFIGFFLLWAGIASASPAINHTEKPMDFGFLNAVLQSQFFPAEDPWLAGHHISYYYFGHLIMAMLVKLTAVSPSVGYNLAIALVPALLASAVFGLLYNLVRLSGAGVSRAIKFAAASPFLIILLGNLEGVLEFLRAQGWGSGGFWAWVGIKGLTANPGAGSGFFPDETWWWWRATRVIDTLSNGESLDYTITEFPFFSFLLGDLHPHLLALPFVMLGLFFCLNLLLSKGVPGPGWIKHNPLESLAIALSIGCLGFLNTWDLPMIAAIFATVVLVKCYAANQDQPERVLLQAGLMAAPVLAAAVFLFLPFYATFTAQANGVLPLLEHGTRPFLFFLVIGLFSLIAVSFLLRQLAAVGRPEPEDQQPVVAVLLIVLAPLFLWALTALIWGLLAGGTWDFLSAFQRLVWMLAGLTVVGLAGYSIARRVRLDLNPETVFPLILLATGFFLLAGVEMFYVSDSFGGSLRRMNTVFKVYYQAWLLLGLAASYGIYYWVSSPIKFPRGARFTDRRWIKAAGHYLWMGLVALLVLTSLYYPVGAVLDRTGLLRPGYSASDNTLDGLAFLQQDRPGEHQAILWLRDAAPHGRIVEAVGDDYSEYGRVSSSSGLPTILGWPGHELQWRGGNDLFHDRADEVADIFQSNNGRVVQDLLDKHQVIYIYLGHREVESYGGEHLHGFEFLESVFSADGVIIFEYVN